MYGGLRFGQQAEHGQHPLAQQRLQRRGGQQRLQLPPAARHRLTTQALHLEMQAPQTAAAPLLQHQPELAGEAEGSQGFLNHRQGHAEVEQGGQQHVARQAGGAIEQGERAHAAGGVGSVARAATLPRRGAWRSSSSASASSWGCCCRNH